jgi:acetoin:2,6-dichlorophenolindophenol oxidoreductase subunit alpha
LKGRSEADLDTAVAVSPEQILAMYKGMVRIRAFETLAHELFLADKLPGNVHLYSGEEAIAVGVMAALRDDDFIASTHRGHGHMIAKGADVKTMMAELFGREKGYCRGKGGSLHIADVALGVMGANGIVGAGIPLATGAAFACRYRETDAVAVSFFGDGATNRGTFHEALNLAGLWDLPIVYVCENNLYAVGTRQQEAMKECNIKGRADCYGMPSVCVDGNDVEAVHVAAMKAVGRARRGEGPSLLECMTWRHHGHFVGEPMLYRDMDEHAEWLTKDPIPRCADEILKNGYATEADLQQIADEARAEMQDAAGYAEECPRPAPTEVLNHVFVG